MTAATTQAARTCERCAAELEADDLRCPICSLAIPSSREAVERPQASVVRCESCGASLAWDAQAQAPGCAYCGSVMRVELAADPPEQAELFLPFTLDLAGARAALERFLARRSFFRPADLAAAATLDSLKALWWPAWIFNARALISWAADSNADTGEASWAPHAGQAKAAFRDIALSASRGLSAEESDRLVPSYDLASARAEPKGPEDARVERFDVSRSGARRQILAAVKRTAEAHIRPDIPGTSVRKVHTAVLLEGLDTDRYGLPAYVLAYRYRGRLYRVVIHGQDPGCVVGKAPVSPWKVLLAIGIGAGVLGAITALLRLGGVI